MLRDRCELPPRFSPILASAFPNAKWQTGRSSFDRRSSRMTPTFAIDEQLMPRKAQEKTSTANIGFEAKLWLAADKLRNNMDAAEYKHVVLGLIFLKYISDSFEEHRAKLIEGQGDYAGANPEDPDEYKAENVFWVPAESRPGRYVGAEEVADDGEPFEEKMPRLVAELHAQFAESLRLEQAIKKNLGGLGF